jgi:hypothetical protein
VGNGALLAINQHPEPDVKGPVLENRSESLTSAPSNGWISDQARPRSTHPEVSLGQISTGDVPATSMNPFILPEHVSPNSDTSRNSNGPLTLGAPVANLSEAEQAEEHDQDATLIDDGDDEDNSDNMWSACTCNDRWNSDNELVPATRCVLHDHDDDEYADTMDVACTCNDRWNSDNELVPATHCVLHDDDNDNYPDYSFRSTTDSEDEASRRERLYPGSSKNEDEPHTVAPVSSGRETSQLPSPRLHLEATELSTASDNRQILEPTSQSLNEPEISSAHTSPLYATIDSKDFRSTSSREKNVITGDITSGLENHKHQPNDDHATFTSRALNHKPNLDTSFTNERGTLVPHFSHQITPPVSTPDGRLALKPDLLRLPSTELVSQNSSSAAKYTKKKKVCGKCFETIDAQFVRALGQKFHIDCFTCWVSLYSSDVTIDT